MLECDRPGTSVSGTQGSKSGSFDPVIRPVSQSGRPVTGFSRPLSQSSGNSDNIRDALQSSRRSGTARPLTTLGREVRLGTASLSSSAGPLVDVEKINVRKYAKKTGLAMALVDYLLYVEHNVRKALDLCVEATKESDFKDWWWKARLGKCYFKLGIMRSFFCLHQFTSYELCAGLFRDAEQQFKSSLKIQPVINTYLELCNVYIRLDLPNTALDLLTEAR